MTKLHLLLSGGLNREVCVDLDNFADDIEAEHPGSDPIPLFCARIQRLLQESGFELDEAGSSKDLASFAGSGYRRGSFGPRLELRVRRSESDTTTARNDTMTQDAGPEHVSGFDLVRNTPDLVGLQRFESLIGIDDHKTQLIDTVLELMGLDGLRAWARRHHPRLKIPALDLLGRRVPLILFTGDVGSGKTELAESLPAVLAEKTTRPFTLLRLGLAARGAGLQGQSTQRIQQAFQNATSLLKEHRKRHVIVLLDEADAIAQSRSEAQMHHEDRAAVNALIQAVDHAAEHQGRMVIVMCTNRPGAIDPALQRRASLILRFERPNPEARRTILKNTLGDLLDEDDLSRAAELMELNGGTSYTASDIVNRIVPASLRLAVRNDEPFQLKHLVVAHETTAPTPPFQE